MMEEVEYNLDDVIIIADQESLIESLMKNLVILRAEVRHCILIESEFETNFYQFKKMAGDLLIKLDALSSIAEKLDCKLKYTTLEFVNKVHHSWIHMIEKCHEEHASFFVASRTVYGIALTSLLAEIKKEAAAMNISLKIGELIYDQEYLIKGYTYFNELTKMLNTLEDCDEQVRKYLIVSKIIKHLQKLDSMINQFASNKNLLPFKKSNLQIFSNVSKLLTGELLGWDPVDLNAVLKENTPKKPVFITRNNRRTQLKSLQNLPLFH